MRPVVSGYICLFGDKVWDKEPRLIWQHRGSASPNVPPFSPPSCSVASMASVEFGITVALIELTLGVVAGNVFDPA